MTTNAESKITADDVIDFMEKGLLENLVLLFKAEPDLYSLIPRLLSDERIMVRLGAAALIESLAEEDPERGGRLVEELVTLLPHPAATVRGDAAYLLGVVGRPEAVPGLQGAAEDENSDVREAAAEALDEISGQAGKRRR